MPTEVSAHLQKRHSQQTSFLFNFINGGIAGAISKTVAAPAERMKLLMQTQSVNAKVGAEYKGVMDCLTRTIKSDGFWSLWRGNWANVVRYFPTQALNFAFKDYFEAFNTYDPILESKNFFIANVVSGGVAGALTAFLVYPLDFARTRLGADIGRKKARQFTGIYDCIRSIYKLDGIKGLYRGIVPATVGIFIYRGLYFGAYDSGKKLYFNENSSTLLKFFFAQICVLLSEGIAYPTDTVKRQLMLQAGENVKHKGSVELTIDIYKKQGLAGFWKGYISNIFRSVGGSLCLILYDEFGEKFYKPY